jgi:hypothetical protein
MGNPVLDLIEGFGSEKRDAHSKEDLKKAVNICCDIRYPHDSI